MHDIAQKQIFFLKLPKLDPDPDLLVKFPDPTKGPDPDPQHCPPRFWKNLFSTPLTPAVFFYT
jgi:hypothetical protein